MSKHTPGIWNWDSDPVKGDPLGRVRYRVVTTGKTVTQCYYSSSDPHAEADARLIAAAPELLRALKACMAWMPNEATFERMGFDTKGARDAINGASAAIAKAEGEA